MASFFFKAHLQYKKRSVFFFCSFASHVFLPPTSILEHHHAASFAMVFCCLQLLGHSHMCRPLSSDSRSRSTLFFIFLRNFQRFPKKYANVIRWLKTSWLDVFYRSLHRLTLKWRLFYRFGFPRDFFSSFVAFFLLDSRVKRIGLEIASALSGHSRKFPVPLCCLHQEHEFFLKPFLISYLIN